MKNIILILILMIFAALLLTKTIELHWNRPWLVSNNKISQLDQVLDEDKIFQKEMGTQSEADSNFNFAFSSFNCFKRALSNFFSPSDDSVLLYYRTPEKLKQDPLPAYNPPVTIPLNSMLKFSLFTGADHTSRDNADHTLLYYGTRFSGFINKRLFITSEWWSGHFNGDLDGAENSHLIDSWYKFNDDNTELNVDNIRGSITYLGSKKFWSVAAGRGKYQIGSNIGGGIILNDACNDYGYISTKFDFKEFYLSYLHGSLIPDSTRINNTKAVPDKFIAVHKIGWTPTANFELFAGEEIIYANRSLDLSYLLPHTFWRATEHNLSNRDNALIFLGSNYKPASRLLIYFNFLLDELKKAEFFGNWWGNKYAVQIGSSYSFQPARSGVISLEVTAIRPWLYTHNILENRFSNDDISLGFPNGSNLIQYTVELNYDLLPELNFNAKGYYQRQGSVGNSFTINYNNRPSDTANWLEGEITDTAMLRPVITWDFLAHHSLKAGYAWNYNRNDSTSDSEIYLSYQAAY